METLEKIMEESKKEVNLIPRKKDFFKNYKFVKMKNKNDWQLVDLQYFTIRKAKYLNRPSNKTYLVKECKKFHLNKIIRQLTMNEVSFLQ
jgi:hypothetical protein